jgi:hypothetical protein
MRLRDEPKHLGGLGRLEKIIGETDDIGFFSFNPAIEITTARCDEGFWGPTSFHLPLEDGSCSCGNIDVDKSTAKVCVDGVMTQGDLVFASTVFSYPPVGFIVYQEMKDPEIEELLCRNHWNSQERTLQELLKLMLEWKDVGDLSNISEVATGLLEAMNMPEDVETWIRSNVPDGAVNRFLAGDPNARDRGVGIPDLPDFVSVWLRSIVDDGQAFGQNNSKAKKI